MMSLLSLTEDYLEEPKFQEIGLHVNRTSQSIQLRETVRLISQRYAKDEIKYILFKSCIIITIKVMDISLKNIISGNLYF